MRKIIFMLIGLVTTGFIAFCTKNNDILQLSCFFFIVVAILDISFNAIPEKQQ